MVANPRTFSSDEKFKLRRQKKRRYVSLNVRPNMKGSIAVPTATLI